MLGLLYTWVGTLLLGPPTILVLRLTNKEMILTYALAGAVLGAALATFIVGDLSSVFTAIRIEDTPPRALPVSWMFVWYGAVAGAVTGAVFRSIARPAGRFSRRA